MKRLLFLLGLSVVIVSAGSSATRAQGTAKGPDPTMVRDQALEKEAAHNLEVARHYFKLRKAYRASLDRCEETIAGYPAFSHFDEVLYIAGMSSYYLSVGQGKQRPTGSQTPEKMRDNARIYLTQLANDFPESAFRAEALQTLEPLGGPLKP
jgi:outer membrane protein assembly factor BamD (BamD/ComL family)